METKMINIKINGNDFQAPDGITILDACKRTGIEIPTLCYLEDVSRNSSCGVCVVEVKGARSLVRSCTACVHEGTEIVTNSARIRDARKTNVELILANHPKDCLSCLRNQNCELQAIASDLGVKEDRFVRTQRVLPLDETSPSLIRDPNKCILCGRCIAVCSAGTNRECDRPVRARHQNKGVDLHGERTRQCCLHQLRTMCPGLPHGSHCGAG